MIHLERLSVNFIKAEVDINETGIVSKVKQVRQLFSRFNVLTVEGIGGTHSNQDMTNQEMPCSNCKLLNSLHGNCSFFTIIKQLITPFSSRSQKLLEMVSLLGNALLIDNWHYFLHKLY